LRWLLEGRLVVWLGRRSYGMYLWHYPVFRILQLDLRWSPYVVLAAGSAIAIVAAAASYAFVEQPFLRLKSKYQ
jgi:peptidoglycan/LPS O-acetylase OafA/YrhL